MDKVVGRLVALRQEVNEVLEMTLSTADPLPDEEEQEGALAYDSVMGRLVVHKNSNDQKVVRVTKEGVVVEVRQQCDAVATLPPPTCLKFDFLCRLLFLPMAKEETSKKRSLTAVLLLSVTYVCLALLSPNPSILRAGPSCSTCDLSLVAHVRATASSRNGLQTGLCLGWTGNNSSKRCSSRLRTETSSSRPS